MKRLLIWCAAILLFASLAGCGKQDSYGDKKEDWAKTAPPPTYRGPGQPGGPPAGAMKGPGGPPPGAVITPQ